MHTSSLLTQSCHARQDTKSENMWIINLLRRINVIATQLQRAAKNRTTATKKWYRASKKHKKSTKIQYKYMRLITLNIKYFVFYVQNRPLLITSDDSLWCRCTEKCSLLSKASELSCGSHMIPLTQKSMTNFCLFRPVYSCFGNSFRKSDNVAKNNALGRRWDLELCPNPSRWQLPRTWWVGKGCPVPLLLTCLGGKGGGGWDFRHTC